jgi:LysM repeat protein
MWKSFLIGCGLAGAAFAQPAASQIEVANLREDVRGLTQRLGDLSLRMEQLERQNADLRQRAIAGDQAYVTLGQLNQAIEEANRTMRATVATAKNETLQIVATQLEKLGQQTNVALESLAKTQGTRAPAPLPPVAADADGQAGKDVSHYTVQKGDTLATIAKKTGAKQQDIITANKLTDPSRINVGQTLLIPNPHSSVAK